MYNPKHDCVQLPCCRHNTWKQWDIPECLENDLYAGTTIVGCAHRRCCVFFLFPSPSGMMLFTWWFPGEGTYTNQHMVQAISFCASAYINNFPRSHGIYIYFAGRQTLRFSYDKMMMPSNKAVISGPGLVCRFAVMILDYPLKKCCEQISYGTSHISAQISPLWKQHGWW